MDVDSITPQDMRFNPPSFREAEVAQLIEEEYGLVGQLSPLLGERDQNFRLQTQQGPDYVVKIAGPDEDPDTTDFQVAALLHLETGSPHIPVPRIVRNSAGDHLSEMVDPKGIAHAVRVVTYLDGIPYAKGADLDADSLQQIGSFMGEVVNGLQGFEHKASRHFMPWNLSNGVAVSRDLWADAATDIKTLAAPELDRLREEVLPALHACPSQVIHNDGHASNLLRADSTSREVVGLIDFGDMVYAPIINELAVTAAAFQRLASDQLGAIENLLIGFHRTHTLSDAEVSLLWDAIILRLLLSVLLSDIKVKLSSGMDSNALEDRTNAMKMLSKARKLDHRGTVNSLRATCGYG
jgi:Ser/Thr protein kinase RdoA (MazF antagonist)